MREWKQKGQREAKKTFFALFAFFASPAHPSCRASSGHPRSRDRNAFDRLRNPAARTLALHLQKGDVKPSYPEGFTARDVYFKGRSGLASADTVREPLELLEHLGWIRGANLSKGGRPTVAYTVNPHIKGVKL